MLQKVPLPAGKIRDAVVGRRDAAARWVAWATAHRGEGPLLWMHAASVGEALAAAPIVQRLRIWKPNLTVIHTHTSPSVRDWPDTFGADARDYAPEDIPRDVRSVFDALRPNLLVCPRADLWPRMLDEAARRGTPVAVVGGGLTQESRRLRWPGRRILLRLAPALRYVGALSDREAALWISVGVSRDAVEATGDPRYDTVLERIPAIAAIEPLLRWRVGRSVLVAGSTHPEDHAMLLEATALMKRRNVAPGLVVVPHEPSEALCGQLARRADAAGLRAEMWIRGAIETDADVIVVGRRGILADLYLAGSLAYVGGGFRPGKLHAVAEPLAFGIPVVVGPCARSARECAQFLRAGAMIELTRTDPAAGLARAWEALETGATALAGRRVLSGGGAPGSARALLRLLDET